MTTAAAPARPRTAAVDSLAPLAGGIAWVTAVAVLRPSPFQTAWAWLLLLLAALVLVPLGLGLVGHAQANGWQRLLEKVVAAVQLPAGLLLGAAFLLPEGYLAAALSVPWLATTGLIALLGLLHLWRHRRGPLHEFTIGAALAYLAVGGFWAFLNRAGIRPLGFESIIVLLTAIHFHYAGFALPLLAGLALREGGGRLGRIAAVGVVAAVPSVAVGITATQRGLGPGVETLSAWLMAGAGALTAWLYLRLALRPGRPVAVRVLWLVAAGSLAFGMGLAALYGSRFVLPLAWLDIPWMRALHGSANALGVGLAGLLSWTLAGRQTPAS